jgi:hypothetical protein
VSDLLHGHDDTDEDFEPDVPDIRARLLHSPSPAVVSPVASIAPPVAVSDAMAVGDGVTVGRQLPMEVLLSLQSQQPQVALLQSTNTLFDWRAVDDAAVGVYDASGRCTNFMASHGCSGPRTSVPLLAPGMQPCDCV